MEGEFVAKPRMFCVNTFWFRNAGTSPGKEAGIFAKGKMSLSRNPWGPDLTLGLSTLRPKMAGQADTSDPCQVGLHTRIRVDPMLTVCWL